MNPERARPLPLPQPAAPKHKHIVERSIAPPHRYVPPPRKPGKKK